MTTTKKTFEYIDKFFESFGCKLLETEYINQSHKMNYRASCGHNELTCYKSFKISTKKCVECAKGVITYTDAIELFTPLDISNAYKALKIFKG